MLKTPSPARTRRVSLAALLPVLAMGAPFFALSQPVALARQAMTFSSMSGPGAGGSPVRAPVTTKDLARFSQVLGLTGEQQDAVKAMLESTVSEFNTVAKEQREKMSEIEAEFQESRDPSVFREKMPEIMQKMATKRGELEKAFLGDLKLTLNPEQEANWDRFERLRRREGYSAGMMGIAGESVDLVKVGENVGVINGPTYDGAAEQVKTIFEQYEKELDAAIQARTKQLAEARAPQIGGDAPPDREAMAKALEEAREKSVALRDINQKFARQVAGTLVDPQLGKWNNEVKKATFPDVYRETYASRAMKAALEMSDLSEEQRTQIQSVRERFDRELSQANETLAKAIAEADETGARGGMVGGANGPTMIRLGDEPESVKAARTAKRELEKKSLESLNGTLTESQRGKLPPRRQPREGAIGEGGVEEGGPVEVMELRIGG
ncbi:MAG: hypothetical protein ACKVZJ_15585 [Phycisphaerales bacterium]